MPQAIISYVGAMPYHGGNAIDFFPFVPCLEARVDGDLLLKVWTQLSFEGGVNARAKLERAGIDERTATDSISLALLRYAVRRIDLLVTDLLATGALPDQSEVWKLGTNDVPDLFTVIAAKTCSFQRRADGDLYCVAAAASDKTATVAIEGRSAAPTTRSFCRSCALPDTDVICSHLCHIEVTGLVASGGVIDRRLVGALCDLGRSEVSTPGKC